jgi:hypothetical protein
MVPGQDRTMGPDKPQIECVCVGAELYFSTRPGRQSIMPVARTLYIPRGLTRAHYPREKYGEQFCTRRGVLHPGRERIMTR